MNPTCKALLTRRTIRRFKPGPVPLETLQLIVRCGAMAASAGNRQPWEFVLAQCLEVVNDLTGMLRWFGGTPDGDGRPAAHVVILLRHPKPRWTVYADAGAAAQNMLIAAWSMGFGACWAASINKKRISALLNLPDQEDLHIFSVLSFGLAAESPVVEAMQKEPPRVFRDDTDRLHVQKRPLDHLCHIDRYGDRPGR